MDKYILEFGQIQNEVSKDKVEARRQPFIRSVLGGRRPEKEHFSEYQLSEVHQIYGIIWTNICFNWKKYILEFR